MNTPQQKAEAGFSKHVNVRNKQWTFHILIYVHRDAKDGKVRGMRPEQPDVPFPEQEYPGFEFTAPVSTDIVTYEVQLYNPDNTGEVYEKFYVKVSLIKIFCIADTLVAYLFLIFVGNLLQSNHLSNIV